MNRAKKDLRRRAQEAGMRATGDRPSLVRPCGAFPTRAAANAWLLDVPARQAAGDFSSWGQFCSLDLPVYCDMLPQPCTQR